MRLAASRCRASTTVVGIDIVSTIASPIPATSFEAMRSTRQVRMEDFDFVWASPPCQAFSAGTTRKGHVDGFTSGPLVDRHIAEIRPPTVFEQGHGREWTP